MKFHETVEINGFLPSLNILNMDCLDAQQELLLNKHVKQPAYAKNYYNKHLKNSYRCHIKFYKEVSWSIFIFFTLVLSPLSAQTVSNSLRGFVRNQSGNGIENINVVIYKNGNDSILTGTTTNAKGVYYVNIPSKVSNIEVVISGVGYKSKLFNISHNGGQVVRDFQIEEQPIELEEIVVRSKSPIIKMTGTTIEMRVKGTALTKSCFFVEQVLNKIPFVAGGGIDYEVFGKGKAEIFLNGIKVSNPETIERYKAGNIKSVKVDLAPGGEIASDKAAAIYIIAENPEDGLSISAYDLLMQSRKFSNASNFALAKYKGNHESFIDVTHSFTQSRLSIDESISYLEDGLDSKKNISSRINYLQLNGGHSYRGKSWNWGVSDIFIGATNFSRQGISIIPNNQSTQLISCNNNETRYIKNNFEFYAGTHLSDRTQMTIQGDYSFGKGKTQTVNNQAQETFNKATNDTKFDRLFATLNLISKWEQSKASYGIEYNWNQSKISATEIDDFGDLSVGGDSHHSEQIIAPFISYNKKFKNWNFMGALRSEFFYYSDISETRKHSLFVPAFNISYSSEKGNYSLGYRRIMKYPPYSVMNNIVHTTSIPYIYKSGNALLTYSYTDRLSFHFSKKQLLLFVNADRINRDYYNTYIPYKKINKNQSFLGKLTILSPYHNFSLGITNRVNVGDYYKTKIDLLCGLRVLGQDFLHQKNYYGRIDWDNDFILPQNYTLGLRLGYSYGASMGLFSDGSNFSNNIVLSKQFGAFYLQFSCKNLIYNKAIKSLYKFHDVEYLRFTYPDNRSISLLISYVFDYKERKYTSNKKGQDLSRF